MEGKRGKKRCTKRIQFDGITITGVMSENNEISPQSPRLAWNMFQQLYGRAWWRTIAFTRCPFSPSRVCPLYLDVALRSLSFSRIYYFSSFCKTSPFLIHFPRFFSHLLRRFDFPQFSLPHFSSYFSLYNISEHTAADEHLPKPYAASRMC